MSKEQDNTTKEEYKIEIDKENRKVIITKDKENHKEINMIFETKTNTHVMCEILDLLSKYYIEDILKL